LSTSECFHWSCCRRSLSMALHGATASESDDAVGSGVRCGRPRKSGLNGLVLFPSSSISSWSGSAGNSTMSACVCLGKMVCVGCDGGWRGGGRERCGEGQRVVRGWRKTSILGVAVALVVKDWDFEKPNHLPINRILIKPLGERKFDDEDVLVEK
jgi:hypothetical protein